MEDLWRKGGDLFLEKVALRVEEIFQDYGISEIGENLNRKKIDQEYQLKVLIVNQSVQVEEISLTRDNYREKLKMFSSCLNEPVDKLLLK